MVNDNNVIEIVQEKTTDKWLDDSSFKFFNDQGDIIFPKDRSLNLQYRAWISQLADPGVDDSHIIKQKVYIQAKRDILFFFNTFLWTFDPRKPTSNLPFITYDYEDDYIKWVVDHIDNKKDCFTEKSRDMGMSWTIMGIFVHKWLFEDGFLAHIGSKKEDDVDQSGNIRSLFEKLRYMLRLFPSWIQPYQFDWKKHSISKRLLNPMNNNTITGESSNRDFGRAGRYRAVLLDEFGAMEYSTEAWTATADSSPCRIVVGTPAGTGNKFWELRYKSSIDRFTCHWTLHPEKSEGAIVIKTKDKVDRKEAYKLWCSGEKISSPWYENEIQRRLTQEGQSKIDIAQELDIDYITSGNPYFNIDALKKQKEWIRTEDWVSFGDRTGRVIIGNLTEIDGKLEFRPNPNGWLRLFERPIAGGQYVGALDPASGSKSGDYAAGAWREKRTRNLVAGIYGYYDYDELALRSYLTSKYFNNCLICAESGGYGSAVNKRLYDLGANVVRAVDLSTGGIVEKDKLGFITNSKTRPQLLGDIEAEIREGAVELRDKDLITECMNFIIDNGKPQAAQGSNDDYIFAFGIAGQLLRLYPYSREVEKNFNKRYFFKKPSPNQGMGFKRPSLV